MHRKPTQSNWVNKRISKKINDLCIIDPTIDQYEIKIPYNEQNQEKENTKEILEKLLQSTRKQITISKDKQKHIANICILLGEEVSSDLYKINIQN